METFQFIKQPIEIEKELLQIFRRDDKLVLFDIGACDGIDSIRYSNLFPNSTIYSFEPLPKNIELFEENIKKYGKNNIIIMQQALSEQTGTAIFYVSSGKPKNIPSDDTWDYGNKSSSLLQPDKHTFVNYDWLKFNEKIEVVTNTLDNFCKTNNIKGIDFMHLDVQGAEMMVLQGGSSLLKQTKVIWLEVEKVSLYQNQPLKKEIEVFMKNQNFSKIKDTVKNICGDQLYINREFIKDIDKFEANFFIRVLNKLKNKLG